jgi:response regulator RpfG family c-di-GMP phosphodiesterase
VDALNQAGVCHYIQKPWKFEEVRAAILNAHASLMADEAQRALTQRLEESNRQLEFALRQRLLS